MAMSHVEPIEALPPGAGGSGIGRTSDLFFLALDELRRLAAYEFRNQRPDHTLQPTALVSELFLRLNNQKDRTWNDRKHFLAFAAKVMHRILIDHANGKNAKKRPGRWHRVPLHEAAQLSRDANDDLDALHEALDALSSGHPRRALVVQLRRFQGLSIKETAEELGVSAGTVEREWRFARAFLSHQLDGRECR